jgi:YD repeat-containing protein
MSPRTLSASVFDRCSSVAQKKSVGTLIILLRGFGSSFSLDPDSDDCSGNLASHTAPDGAQTLFRYDGQHKLIAHISEGN